jgi:acyl CoA:acetate/3-ketoacid CoA transferase alpha subunit
MDKVVRTVEEAISGIADGATLSVGGFGLCGIPSILIDAILEARLTDLEVFPRWRWPRRAPRSHEQLRAG